MKKKKLLFLVEGTKHYLGSSPRTIYHRFEANSVKEAVAIMNNEDMDVRDRNYELVSLKDKILFQKVVFPK